LPINGAIPNWGTSGSGIPRGLSDLMVIMTDHLYLSNEVNNEWNFTPMPPACLNDTDLAPKCLKIIFREYRCGNNNV
jgi:hypothetical protein